MTQFSGYLTDEVVEDYSDGVIGRREALRRLGLLGVAAAAAVPLLAACDAGRAASDRGRRTAGTTRRAGAGRPAGPLPTEAITFAGPGGRTCRAPGRRPPTSRAARCWSCTRTAA